MIRFRSYEKRKSLAGIADLEFDNLMWAGAGPDHQDRGDDLPGQVQFQGPAGSPQADGPPAGRRSTVWRLVVRLIASEVRVTPY